MTYSQLKSDLIEYSARSDISALTATFIRLAEPRIYRRLRILDMETDVTLTITSANDYGEALPTGFVGFKSLYASGVSNGRMVYVPPNIFHMLDNQPRDAFHEISPGDTVYTIESGKIKVEQATGATGDVVVEAVYFKRFLPLSDANTSNAALANHYDLFLSAGLEQVWRWARKTEERLVAKTEVDRILGEIEDEQTMLRMPPAPITTRMPRNRVA
jgi:hypothetical protein